MWCYTIPPLLLNMTLTGSFIILFVLLARLALKKAPKIYSYALWAVVLFRLLCPVSFSAPVSLLGALEAPTATQSHTVEYISPTIVHDAYPSVDIPVTTVGNAINTALPQGEEQTVADPLEAPAAAATAVWLFGMGAMAAYSLISLSFLRRKLVGAVLLHGNVYLADHIDSPFVMGLVRPKIYLPSTLSESEQSYILLHELHHIRRFDHIWKLLGFLALCVHWFNPLVWVSFVLAAKDMEMSCDEAVLKKMGRDIRADYSASLLSLATGRRIIAGAPLAFGEGDTKSRIKNALKWQESPAWVKALCAVCCGLVVVLCAANPEQPNQDAPEPFGHSYRVAETIYGSGDEFWPESSFVLASDYMFRIREGNSWLTLGFFQDAELPESIPDDLRNGNKAAWICTVSEAPSTGLYYLMHQTDGAILLAQGTTPGLNSNTGGTIEHIFRLIPAESVEASLYTTGLITHLGSLDWYPEGFDFDYDTLQAATVYGSATLTFKVEGDPDRLIVSEDYYAQTEDGPKIQKATLTLFPDENGYFNLSTKRQNNYDEYAIYCVAHDDGKYVIRIDFPFEADMEGMELSQVEAMFTAEHPQAVILDSVLAYDGKYEVVGVVLYQEQANMLHLAYVNQDGWSQTVGLGSEETPLTAVDDPQLAYLGNGTVTWLCEQNSSLLRCNMEFSVTGSHVSFRPTSAPAWDTPPDGYYVTDKCLYLPPYSSVLYPNGDDGKRYFLYEDTFTVTDRSSGQSNTYEVDWAWDDDPFTSTSAPAPILQGEDIRWQKIRSRLYLAQTAGKLLVVTVGDTSKPLLAIGSIFNLVPDTGYIPSSPLVSAVTEAVNDAFFHNNTMNALSRCHYVILDTRELFHVPALVSGDSSYGKLTVVDLMALGMDFHMVEGTLTPIRERVLEMTLTFKEEDGGYVLTDKESTVLPDAGDYGLPLYQGCYSQALTYFGVDTGSAVAKLFDALEASPAESSDPGDHISAHGLEYQELQFYGKHTLEFIFRQFLKGGETGLRGHLMRAVLDELAPESALRLSAATAQEYFDAWLEAARSMEDEIGIARMEHEYPAGWLCLRLAENSAAAPAAVFTAALPLKMTFCSGAGAWQTNLTLNPDLTFSGEHRDDDIGTCYLCRFSGRFESLTPVSRYACTIDLAELEQETKEGQEWLENGVRHVAVGPYGLEGGERFTLYLPGTPTADFPQDFWFWYPEDDRPESLLCCALVNEATGDVFFSPIS